jgi:hypothetical protein
VPTASPIRTAQPTTRPTPPRGSNDGSYSSPPVTPVPTSVVVTDAPTPVTTVPRRQQLIRANIGNCYRKPRGVPDDIVNAQCYLVTDGCADDAAGATIGRTRAADAPTSAPVEASVHPAVVTSAPTSVVVSNVPTPATNTGTPTVPDNLCYAQCPYLITNKLCSKLGRPNTSNRHSSSYLVTDICAAFYVCPTPVWRFPAGYSYPPTGIPVDASAFSVTYETGGWINGGGTIQRRRKNNSGSIWNNSSLVSSSSASNLFRCQSATSGTSLALLRSLTTTGSILFSGRQKGFQRQRRLVLLFRQRSLNRAFRPCSSSAPTAGKSFSSTSTVFTRRNPWRRLLTPSSDMARSSHQERMAAVLVHLYVL